MFRFTVLLSMTLFAAVTISGASLAAELATVVGVLWIDEMAAVGGTSSEKPPATMGPLTDSISDGFTDGAESFMGSATATADFGTLGVAASANVINSDNIASTAVGVAGFTDSFIFEGGPTGSAGEITFTFNITGSSTVTGDGTVVAGLYVFQNIAADLSELLGDATIVIDGDDLGVDAGPFPITFGTTTDFTFALSVTSLVPIGATVPYSGSADGAYDQTVQLVDIQGEIPDVGTVPLDITTGSGTDYLGGASSAAVPEHSTAVLAMIGLLSFAVCSTRRRRHSFRGIQLGHHTREYC